MTRDLHRRLDRVCERTIVPDDAEMEYHYRVASKALEYPGILEAAKPYCDWLAEKCGGRVLSIPEMLPYMSRWCNEDRRGIDLAGPVTPFIERAMQEVPR
jgi:hypothetical protein